MKKFIPALSIVIILVTHSLFVHAQSSEETLKQVDELNRTLDRAVVNKDLPVLQKHYAEDFVFTHSDGKVDSKHSWIKSVEHAHYISREHDSTKVELHNEIAIVTGKLNIERKAHHSESPQFSIKYVRVFSRRDDVWQLICHRSVLEMEL